MDGGSWFNHETCPMNTAIHKVEARMSPSVSSSEEEPVPWCPQVRYSPLPDLSELVLRSNQTARCDECASLQTRREYSRCCLALCEQAFCFLVFFGSNTVVFLPVALRHRTHTLFSCQRTIDMLPYYHKTVKPIGGSDEKTSDNHSLRRQGQRGDCCNQGTLWYHIGCWGNSDGSQRTSQKHQAGSQPITPRKVGPFIPQMNQGAFWPVDCKTDRLLLIPFPRLMLPLSSMVY